MGRLVGVLCACLLFGSTVGCDAADAAGRAGPVLLVGDSIFALSKDELTWVLRSEGWDVTVDAHSGAGIRGGGYAGVDWPPRLRDLVRLVDPEIVVVELGTNGCGPCDSVPDAIDDVMQPLSGVETVLWLKVRTDGAQLADAAAVNAALEDATGRWSNLELLPYDMWVAGRPDLLPPDDVHPTAAGERALAQHVGDALREHAPPDDRSNRAIGALALVVVAAILLRSRSKA